MIGKNVDFYSTWCPKSFAVFFSLLICNSTKIFRDKVTVCQIVTLFVTVTSPDDVVITVGPCQPLQLFSSSCRNRPAVTRPSIPATEVQLLNWQTFLTVVALYELSWSVNLSVCCRICEIGFNIETQTFTSTRSIRKGGYLPQRQLCGNLTALITVKSLTVSLTVK